jgi:ubiquinone/menaquinone biosynthesis C-methylase UbiE
MEQTDYEYKGLIAAFWDLLRGDTSNWPDRFFFQDVIRAGGTPALDVGCGTGRLLLDFLAQGIDIDGVDNSPEMLARCRAKAAEQGLHPRLFQQSMEALDLPRRYRTIIVPSCSFQLITDREAAAAVMRRFLDHLEPGGTLAMPFSILWTGEDDQPIAPKDWFLLVEKENPADGTQVRRWIRHRYDLDQQLEHTEDRYEVVRDGAVIATEYHARSPATRWYTQEEAADLYRQAGFTGIRLTHGNTLDPALPDDTLFGVLGTR